MCSDRARLRRTARARKACGSDRDCHAREVSRSTSRSNLREVFRRPKFRLGTQTPIATGFVPSANPTFGRMETRLDVAATVNLLHGDTGTADSTHDMSSCVSAAPGLGRLCRRTGMQQGANNGANNSDKVSGDPIVGGEGGGGQHECRSLSRYNGVLYVPRHVHSTPLWLAER